MYGTRYVYSVYGNIKTQNREDIKFIEVHFVI